MINAWKNHHDIVLILIAPPNFPWNYALQKSWNDKWRARRSWLVAISVAELPTRQRACHAYMAVQEATTSAKRPVTCAWFVTLSLCHPSQAFNWTAVMCSTSTAARRSLRNDGMDQESHLVSGTAPFASIRSVTWNWSPSWDPSSCSTGTSKKKL